MKSVTAEVTIPDEMLLKKIYLIRGKKVMLDRDLAELYGVETKRLKEAVRRNINRFPEEFMFELTKEEFANWRSQNATSNSEKMGLRIPPFAFTEYGTLMLASVLNSEQAILVNIRIIKVFTGMKEMLRSNNDLRNHIEQIILTINDHGEKIKLIFDYIRKLENTREEMLNYKNRKQIGYKPSKIP